MTSEERLDVLKESVAAMSQSIDAWQVMPDVIGEDGIPMMVVAYRFNDPTAAKFAKLVFEWNKEAREVNGTTLAWFGMHGLERGVCKLCKSMRSENEVSDV